MWKMSRTIRVYLHFHSLIILFPLVHIVDNFPMYCDIEGLKNTDDQNPGNLRTDIHDVEDVQMSS